MRSRNLHYNLEQGFIHNWLVAGPQAIAVEPGLFKGDNIRQQIVQQYYESDSGITETPVERGPLTEGIFQLGDYKGSWEYLVCREDHLIEHSGFYSSPHYLRSWAYTQLNSKMAQEIWLVLTTHGPADVWLNEQHVHRQEHFCKQQPQSGSFKVSLKQGINKFLVRFEAVAMRECANAMALQVMDPDEESAGRAKRHGAKLGIEVTIPTLIEAISRRNKFEQAAAATYIVQDVFEIDNQIRLHWPDDLKHPSAAVIRLITPKGQIYAEATVDGTAGDQVFLQHPRQIPAGPYRVFMMPLAWEYYDHNLRITREINLWSLGRSRYSAAPYGTYKERCQEALISATQGTGLYAEIAKMALGQWSVLEIKKIFQFTKSIDSLELLGVVGMLYRFSAQSEFPQELVQPLEDAILSYPYEHGEVDDLKDGDNESNRILSYAVEILAGQRYPDRIFICSGKRGQWHRQNAEQLALDWLHKRGAEGFSDWDSNSSFAEYIIALSHLVDLAETEFLWEMAAVVMDKIFATMAINSFRGVFGSTQGRALAPHVKGGLLEPTSGIARLMWGIGIFNHHIAGPVSLVCMQRYEFPSIISDVALFLPEDMWSRERHAVGTARQVNKVTHKTPDGMLCSAQDYYPGQKGWQEHIWQATLGTTATVFVTHPACSSEEEARRPNFWVGNAVLPRVAQWKDALIAFYQLPEDDWMGFTHAYFPTYAFDEYLLRQGWAFARKDNGYLAIMARQGIQLTKHGHYALRELRSYGLQNAWLCHMGRAALDGEFSSFQEKILGLNVKFADAHVHFTTLRGEALSFGWQGPFLRNDIEQPLSGFDHYENPFAASEFPSSQMELRYGDALLRLNFESVSKSQIE